MKTHHSPRYSPTKYTGICIVIVNFDLFIEMLILSRKQLYDSAYDSEYYELLGCLYTACDEELDSYITVVTSAYNTLFISSWQSQMMRCNLGPATKLGIYKTLWLSKVGVHKVKSWECAFLTKVLITQLVKKLPTFVETKGSFACSVTEKNYTIEQPATVLECKYI
jgi:hypothetical protein